MNNTNLIVSEGVTANIASIIPAPRPAKKRLVFIDWEGNERCSPSRLRGALTLPLTHNR